MSAVRDRYLELPLDGVRLIEASAGTGKTYTLATLVTRLVVERGLRIGQILAVTFTDAATQELRKRIRERLQLTLALIDAPLADDEPSDATLTRQLLQSHRANGGESDDTLRHRLRQCRVVVAGQAVGLVVEHVPLAGVPVGEVDQAGHQAFQLLAQAEAVA